MKRTFFLLLALLMVFIMCACDNNQNQDVSISDGDAVNQILAPSDILVSEKWVSPGQFTLTFYITGSGGMGEDIIDDDGVLHTYTSSIGTFVWEIDDNKVNLSFEGNSSRNTTYILEQINGVYHLSSSSDHAFYVRESEREIDSDFAAIEIMLSEKWINSLGTEIILYDDGSGQMDDGMNNPTDITWEYLGNSAVRVHYDFLGNKIADFVLEQVDSIYRLTYVGGEMHYVRESDYK